MEEINQLINSIIEKLCWFYEQYKILVFIVLAIIIILILIHFLASLFNDLKILKDGFVFLAKKLWWVLKLPFLLLKKAWSFILWIFQARRRYLYKKSLKESVFNVSNQSFKTPIFYYLFSHKVRKQKKYRLRCIEECIATEEKINHEFKFIIMIEAAIGGGKTSFLNGFSHMKTLSLMKKIDDDLSDIEKKLYQVNYFALRREIEKFYKLGDSEINIKNKLLKDELINSHFSGNFNDHVSSLPKFSLLENYIKAYTAKLRNNFVMSNYKLENRITKTFNFELSSNAFDIKDPEAQKKFFLPPYLIIVDDEKALSDFKNTETPKELDKKGTDITMRLFRQLQNETTYYISSTQNTSRIALIIRELANTYVQINRFSIIGEQNHLENIYRLKEEKLYNKMLKFASRHFKTESEQQNYLLNNNKFKPKIFDLFDKQKQLFSSAFLSYSVKIAPKLDLLKEECKELRFVFPLTWCYGVYNTCEYSEFNEFLANLSEVKSDHELKVISSLYEKNEERYKKLIEIKAKKDESKKKKETTEQ